MLGTHMYAGGSVGLAVLRRDGFASMSTGAQGELLTKPLLFSGGYLFVNADAAGGNLSVEIRDAENRPIPGFAASDCRPVTTDGVSTRVEWANGDVAALSGRPVRFHFQLDTADLYAFWVSRLPTGQSDGYLAAGGPGYSGVVDN